MDPKFQQMLLGFLQQLLRGVGGSSYNPFGAGMNEVNTGSLREGMVSQILGGVLPGLKAGPGRMTIGDMNRIREREALEAETYRTTPLPPGLRSAMESSGIPMGKFENPDKTPTAAGQAFRTAYWTAQQRLFGNMAPEDIINKSRMIYSGTMFGARPGGPMFGMSEEELRTHQDRLRGMAEATDAKGNKTGRHTIEELFEAQTMGASRGMMMGADVRGGDIEKRTESIANALKTGMNLFKHMSKEGVMDVIQELSAGTIPVGAGEAQLTRAMFNVSALAKQANVSIELMQRFGAEGAAMYKKMGIMGTAGFNQTLQTGFRLQALTSHTSAGGAIVDANAIARAGGLGEVQGFMGGRTRARAGADLYKDAVYLAREGVASGAMTQEQADAYLGRLNSTDPKKKLKASDNLKLLRRIAKASGQDAAVLRDDMIAEGGQAVEERIEKFQAAGKGYLIEDEMQNQSLNEALGQGTVRKSWKTVGKTKRDQDKQVSAYIRTKMKRLGQRHRGEDVVIGGKQYSESDAQALLKTEAQEALSALAARTDPNSELGRRYRAHQKTKIEEGKNRAAEIAMETKAAKEGRPLTFFEKVQVEYGRGKDKSPMGWAGAVAAVTRGTDQATKEKEGKLKAEDKPGEATGVEKILKEILGWAKETFGGKEEPKPKVTTDRQLPAPTKGGGPVASTR